MASGGKLMRRRAGEGRMIAGVCGGLADHFGLPLGLVRVGFVIFGLVGVGEFAYIGLWVFIPKAN